METILRDAPPSEETRNIKLALAQMLIATDNAVGARARVEEVLAEDTGNVEALKMRAAWLIQDDKPGEAILALRTALDQNPRDPGILTLMGEAHERDGSRELAGERYALAVEVSGNGAQESLRYARYLIADTRLDPVGAVLENALRVSPQDVALLVSLADVIDISSTKLAGLWATWAIIAALTFALAADFLYARAKAAGLAAVAAADLGEVRQCAAGVDGDLGPLNFWVRRVHELS